MNKNIIYLCFCLILSALFFACSKDLSNLKDAKSENYVLTEQGIEKTSCDYEFSKMEEKDKVKVLLSKFVGESLKNNDFKNYLLNELFFNKRGILDSESNEFFIAEHLNDPVLAGTFLSEMEKYYQETSEYAGLFDAFCDKYADLVISIPWFGESIMQSSLGYELQFGLYANVDLIACDNKRGSVLFTETGESILMEEGKPAVGFIPISVKETEEHVLIDVSTGVVNEELSINQLLEQYVGYNPACDITNFEFRQFMKTIDCANSSYLDLIKLGTFVDAQCSIVVFEESCGDCEDNDGDGLVDCEDPDCECTEGEICGDGIDNDCNGLIDLDDPACDCDAVCDRDCILETMSLQGIAFANPSMWREVCQLPGEEIIRLNYNFIGVSICDPFNNVDCPPSAIGQSNYTFWGATGSKFFELQGPWQFWEEFPSGNPPIVDEDGVAVIQIAGYSDGGQPVWNYWKAWPKYAEVGLAIMGNWNGDALGNRILFDVVENDTYQVSGNYSTSVQSTVSNTAQQNWNNGSGNTGNNGSGSNGNSTSSTGGSFTFNTGVTNSTTTSTNVIYDKDVSLGQYRIFYCDNNESFPDPFGYTDTWYGFIPDYNGLSGLYSHMQITY